jgi:hypothetical protein
MDGNIKDTPPIVVVPRSEDREKWDDVSRQSADIRGQIDARRQAARPEFENWSAHVSSDEFARLIPTQGLVLDAPLNEGDGRALHFRVDNQPREVSLSTGYQWSEGRHKANVFSLDKGETIELSDVGDFEGDSGFSCAACVRLPRQNSRTYGLNVTVSVSMSSMPGLTMR